MCSVLAVIKLWTERLYSELIALLWGCSLQEQHNKQAEQDVLYCGVRYCPAELSLLCSANAAPASQLH